MSEPLIVVPLDGSDLSEGALPYAVALAKATGARLLLITVWEGTEQTLNIDMPDLAEDLLKRGEEHYGRYLAGVSKKVEAEHVEVEAQVLIGNPAEEILRLLEQREPRLLAMASHGRSGLGRWWYGSVASKLVRRVPVPTLIVGPKVLEDGPATITIRRILVPLDSSDLAETALQPARELAEALGADLMLAQVLHWVSQAFTFGVPDVDVARIDDELTKAAQQYLARVKEGLRTQRLVETRVLRGMPADALIDLVSAEKTDLVVMASHTRGGLARAALGSAADRMLQGKAPVLLIRPEGVTAVVRASRGRYCHTCARAVRMAEVTEENRCLGCGQHLHICANCVYYDGIACLLQRSEVHDTYPGLNCPEFQFRETPAPIPGAGKSQGRAAEKN